MAFHANRQFPTLNNQRLRPALRTASGVFPDPLRTSSHLVSDQPPRSLSQPLGVPQLKAATTNATSRIPEPDAHTAVFGTSQQLCRSPDAVEVDVEDGEVAVAHADGDDGYGSERPAKRVKTTGRELRSDTGKDLGRSSGDDGDDDDDDDAALRIVPGSPLPTKRQPWLGASIQAHRTRHPVHSASTRANGLIPPAIATRAPPPRQVLDFHPWTTGQHPEDILNENTIKNGHLDKGPGSGQTETNSARASIWPVLSQKNHAGLQMLSYLYTQTMEKRLALGRCTAQPTFKPPPRVTVTDNKREAWLRDLANPRIPLRKQSRTIPHGIRGVTLMEQCLSKAVPWQRAIWLAKCVGANEMRAFRRKGVVGGSAAVKESKWVREWTVNVETFLGNIVATCGQSGWSDRMQYSLRFTTALYAEDLLDANHFLDWLVSSFATSPPELLAVWTLLLRTFWRDIPKFGRRGRRLAAATLEHLHQNTHNGDAQYVQLRQHLQRLIAALQLAGRGCLLIPGTWDKHKALLSPTVPSKSDRVRSVADNIAKRNNRLVAHLGKAGSETKSPMVELLAILDGVDVVVDIEQLASTCLDLVSDKWQLAHTLLDWASTPYRVGLARTYLAARLLSRLRTQGFDTDNAILHYIAQLDNPPESTVDSIQRVIIELARLESFSVGRYIQWLISTRARLEPTQRSYEAILLTALPTDGLPLRLKNTIKTIAARFGCADDPKLLEETAAHFYAVVENSAHLRAEHLELLQSLRLAAKFNISHYVCAKTASMAENPNLLCKKFPAIRQIVEDVRDIASLGELVRVAATIDNADLLATVVDVIGIYADSFAAMEELDTLVSAVKERYAALRQQHALHRILILSFMTLIRRVTVHIALANSLADDLAICEQQISLAVCSPASDSLITMHASALDSAEQIDAVFASGNTMDEQLMRRVFDRILAWPGKSSTLGDYPIGKECDWLSRLRSVDSNAFDQLAHQFLHNTIKSTVASNSVLQAVTTLVVSGSVDLETFAKMAGEAPSANVAMTALQLLTDRNAYTSHLGDCERHRFLAQQQLCQIKCAESLLMLVRKACETSEFQFSRHDSVEFMIQCIVKKPGSVQRILHDDSIQSTGHENLIDIYNAILQRSDDSRDTGRLDEGLVVEKATFLAIPFCAGFLRAVPKSLVHELNSDDKLGDAIMQACMRDSEVWPQLLEFAGTTKSRIYEWALHELLLGPTKLPNPSTDTSSDHLTRCFDVLAILKNNVAASDNLTVISALANKLRELEKALASEGTNETSGDVRTHFDDLLDHLGTSLNMVSLYAMDNSDGSEALQQARCYLLSTLCGLLLSPRLQMHATTMEYMFDLASILSDSLPEELLETIKRPDTSADVGHARLDAILGPSSLTEHGWLAVVSQVHALGVSQQQRILNKYASQPSPLSAGAQWSSQNSHPQQPQQHNQQTANPGSPQSVQTPTPQQHRTGLSQSSLSVSIPPQHLRKSSLAGLSSPLRQESRGYQPAETKTMPFHIQPWELMSDPTPLMGANDASLSLTLFAARKIQ